MTHQEQWIALVPPQGQEQPACENTYQAGHKMVRYIPQSAMQPVYWCAICCSKGDVKVILESLSETFRVGLRNSARRVSSRFRIAGCQQIYNHRFQHRYGNTILRMLRRLQYVCHILNIGGREVRWVATRLLDLNRSFSEINKNFWFLKTDKETLETNLSLHSRRAYILGS